MGRFLKANPEEASTMEPPVSYRHYIQGNPGAGKSFVVNTMRNLVRNFFQSKERDIAVTPTGCSAALIRATTSTRGLKIPTGRQLKQAVSDKLPGTAASISFFAENLQSCFQLTDDESSMKSRQQNAWAEGRCSTLRRSETATGKVDPRVARRTWGGIPVVNSLGDCHQLPPVAALPHYDESVSKSGGSDEMGRQVHMNFISMDTDAEYSLVTVMDEAIRQRCQHFKDIINEMRNTGMSRESATVLMNRHLENLPQEERDLFIREALYLMPTWKSTIPITKEYLKSLGTPVARIKARYQHSGRQNHAKKECSLPETNALAKDALVMLLVNFVVEENTFNGAVGKIVQICYEHSDGPRNPDALPDYVVVDFPGLNMDPNEVWDDEYPTHVPVPCYTQRCEKNCCSMTTVPLRVCKAITQYKGQGMSCGEGHVWKRVVICLPKTGKTPGLEQVAVSRATDLSCLAFMDFPDGTPLTLDRFMKIGIGPAYDKRRVFVEKLRLLQAQTHPRILEKIGEYDPEGKGGFNRGYNALVEWYRNSTTSQVVESDSNNNTSIR